MRMMLWDTASQPVTCSGVLRRLTKHLMLVAFSGWKRMGKGKETNKTNKVC